VIAALVTPAILTANVIVFLEEHIRFDLYLLGKAFNKNAEDTKLLIHIMLKLLLCNTNRNSKFRSYPVGKITKKTVRSVFINSALNQKYTPTTAFSAILPTG